MFRQGKKKQNAETEKNGDIINMLDSAFDEDISEISEISDVDEGEDKQAAAARSNTFHFLLGLFIMVMAVVGIISTISFGIAKIKNIADNTEQKNEFSKFIYPVVICDPPAFGNNTMLKNETLISAAVWDIILYENKDKYTKEFDYMIVPEIDIEQHASKLFGSGLNLKHTTIRGGDVSFYYDGTQNSYRIPENPKFFTYSPYIEKISRNGDSYTLTVGYVSPTPAWLTLTSDETPSPEKYVDYIIQKNGSKLTLTAITASETVPAETHETGL